MVTPLFKQGLRNIAPLFGAVVAVLLVYIGTVVYLYDPSVSESLALMQEAMPELFAVFGMANPSATLLDFLLNYLYGFLLTATFVLLGAFMAQRYVVGPAKDGSLAWTLATPHSRTSLALTLAVVEAVAVVALTAILTVIEIALCEALFPKELQVGGLIRANLGLATLGLFVSSICFASGSFFQRPDFALWIGAGICLVFLLAGLAGTVGEGLAWLTDLSPFALYDAYGLASGDGGAAVGSAALAGASVLLFAAGVVSFGRRDFSV